MAHFIKLWKREKNIKKKKKKPINLEFDVLKSQQFTSLKKGHVNQVSVTISLIL